MSDKVTLAVFFGGRSPEHDVSIISGLQAIGAIDHTKYDVVPVYVAMDGKWYTGEPLLDRLSYIPSDEMLASLTHVELCLSPGKERSILRSQTKGMFGKAKDIFFDVAFLAFHGGEGEDGRFQALFEIAGTPYTGMRRHASDVFMDKVLTKTVMSQLGIPVLPSWVIARPVKGLVPNLETVKNAISGAEYPLLVKPANLGSSIGVAMVKDFEELYAVLPTVLRLDDTALIEPFVQNLTEYNVSVCGFDGDIRCSAIERPKCTSELLSFSEKYASADGKSGPKSGGKAPGQSSQGMLSLTRDIAPSLPDDFQASIIDYAKKAFSALDPYGAPRIDFLSNSETGELWLNEVNPCPGSFGYFLWEAAERPILFSDLIDKLVEEAQLLNQSLQSSDDATPVEARLFKR